MIELINEAKEKFKEFGEAYLVDKHVLRKGIYIQVKPGDPITEKNVLVVDSHKEREIYGKYPLDKYNWFRKRDFYIPNVEINKAIDGYEKKILSTVPYALHILSKNLPDRIKVGLCKPNQKELGRNPLNKSETFEYIVRFHFRKMGALYPIPRPANELADDFISIVKESMKTLAPIFEEKIKDDSLAIKWFIDVESELYKQYHDYYLQKRAFGKEEYNYIDEQGKVYGASSFLMNLNENKPLLLSSTTSFEVPYRIPLEDAVFMFRLKLVLSEVAADLGYEIERNDDFGVISVHNTKDKNDYQIEVTDFKILQVPSHHDIKIDGFTQKSNRHEFAGKLNGMFRGLIYPLYHLNDNMKMEAYRKKFQQVYSDSNFLQALVSFRTFFRNYFYESIDLDLLKPLSQLFSFLFFEEVCKQKDFTNRKDIQILWDKMISILAHFERGDSYMNVAPTIAEIHESLNRQYKNEDEVFVIENDYMFYHLVGQSIYYMLSQSNSGNKSGRIIGDYLLIKETDELKRAMIYLYEVYGYKLPFYSKDFFNRVVQSILVYVPNYEYQDLFAHYYHSGLIGPNIFIKLKVENSKKKGEGNNGDSEKK